MRYYLINILIAALFITGCNSEAQAPESVEEKEKQLASYKEEMGKLYEELNELKDKIGSLETDISKSKGNSEKKALRLVTYQALQTSKFNHYIEVPGEVKSDKNIQVNPEISGVILKRNVEEGAYVKQGQVIAVLDAEVLKGNIAEVETRLSLAESIYQRQENLWKQNIGSEVQYLQAKNQKEALEKNLETIKTQLGNAYIKAPISGTLDEYFMNTGEMASPQAPIARIVNLATVEVSADVSETYVKDIKRGDEVVVSFTAIGEDMELPVVAVGQFINPQNRTFKISMKAANKEGYLKPNTLAMVKINDYTLNDAITVSANLIQRSTNGEAFIYVLEEKNGKNYARKVVVETGRTYDGQTVILKGLNVGAQVITKGYNEVVDGEEVKDATTT
jgi:RND family efflux transporter MFP subunit